MKRAVASLVNAFYEAGDPFGYRDFESIISPESPEDYARYPDFDSYMDACMVRNNGSLAPIHELAETDVVTFLDEKEALDYINEAAVKYGLSETEKTRLLDMVRDFYS